MIHCITAANRHLYAAELQDLHRRRADCFIDERGWPLTRTAEGEFDAYDDASAVYLVAFGADRAVTAGCRVRPTERGGLIPDHFNHLVSEAERPLAVPGTYECTRYFCVPGLRGAAGLAARSGIHTALIEHLNDMGGDRLVGFVDLPLLTHLRRFSGLRIRPIGLPSAYDGGAMTIAFEIGVTPDDLIETRGRLGQSGRQLFVAPGWVPAGTDPHDLAAAVALLASPETAGVLGEAIHGIADRSTAGTTPRVVGSAA